MRLLIQWCTEADPLPHDVWRIRLEVHANKGKILKVGSDREEHVQDTSVIDSPMLNYLSLGQDSQAGFDFEKHRGTSQTGNLAQYGKSGAKVATSESSNTINETIRGLYHGESQDGIQIFSTEAKNLEGGAPRLLAEQRIFLVLNIQSCAGGSAPFLWKASNMRCSTNKPHHSNLLKFEQNPGDGMLEVLTLRHAARVLTGSIIGGRRVFQGAPLFMNFHEAGSAGEDIVAYLNIDGEFYKVVNPDSLTITLRQRLQVLHHKLNSMDMNPLSHLRGLVHAGDHESASGSDSSLMSEEDNPRFGCC